MREIFKGVWLFVVAIIVSYVTASYFGVVYDYFAPQHDSLFGAPKEITNLIVGFPFAYTFFIVLLFQAFSVKHKQRWLMVLLAPIGLLWLLGDLAHIYLPLILGLLGWVLGAGIHRLIYRKGQE